VENVPRLSHFSGIFQIAFTNFSAMYYK